MSVDGDYEGQIKRKIREVLAEIEQRKQGIREVLTGIAQEKIISDSKYGSSTLTLDSLVEALNRVAEAVLADSILATPDMVEAFANLLQKQEDPTLRSAAIKELERIVMKYEDCAGPAIPAFKQILTEERKKNIISEDSYTEDAVKALGACGQMYEAHAGAVIEILSEESLNKYHMAASKEAIERMGVIGVAHKSQTGTVVKALTHIVCNTDKDNIRHVAHPSLAIRNLRAISLEHESQADTIAQTFADILKNSQDYNSSLHYGAINGLADIGNKFESRKKEMISILNQVLVKIQARGFYYVETDVIKQALNSLGYEPEKTPEELEKERQWKESSEKVKARVEEEMRKKKEKKSKEQEEEQQSKERVQNISTLAEKIFRFSDVTGYQPPQKETSQEEETPPQDQEDKPADMDMDTDAEAVDNQKPPKKTSLARKIFNKITRRRASQETKEIALQDQEDKPADADTEAVKPPSPNPVSP